jgi:hypothetical protein
MTESKVAISVSDARGHPHASVTPLNESIAGSWQTSKRRLMSTANARQRVVRLHAFTSIVTITQQAHFKTAANEEWRSAETPLLDRREAARH